MAAHAGSLSRVVRKLCQPFFSSRSYSEDLETKFYNSQAGRWMTKPGALGLRVHELYSAALGLTAITYLRDARPSSFQWDMSLGDPTAQDLQLVVPVSSSIDIVALAQEKKMLGPGFQPLVPLQLSPTMKDEDLHRAQGLVKDCAKAGLPAWVMLQRAWDADSSDPDTNLHANSLYETTLTLADAEAAVITLSDCLGKATEDSLRDAVEGVFNIDCGGESMMERLALRLPCVELCRGAMRLGVTRFHACACPHAPTPGRTKECTRPPAGGGGCICATAGLKPVVGTEQLVAVAEEQGIKHAMGMQALKAARAKLLHGI